MKTDQPQEIQRPVVDDVPKFMQKKKICYCFGQTHKLITNCQSCGKVICENEGESDCIFCQQPLFMTENQDLITNAYFEKAVFDKQKLLESQSNINSKKDIIDDQNDWLDVKHDIWQSKAVRKLADEQMDKQKVEAEHQKQFIVYDIDLKTGTVIGREVEADYSNEKKQVKDFLDFYDEKNSRTLNLEENKIDDDNLKQAVFQIKSNLEKAKGKPPVPSARKPLSKVVQNDDAFNILLEFEKLTRKEQEN